MNLSDKQSKIKTCRDVTVIRVALPCLQTKDELVRWEESKKWQAKMEKLKNVLKERERENETVSKQLRTLKDLYGRLVTDVCHVCCKLETDAVRF